MKRFAALAIGLVVAATCSVTEAADAVRMGCGIMTFDTVPGWGLDAEGKSQIGPTHGSVVVDSKGQQRFSAWSQMFVSGADFGTPYLPTMNGTNYVDEGGSAGAEWNDADGWHGADATGNVIASATCSDWTSTGGSGQCTELDAFDVFKQENKACSLLHAVMCVSIDGGT